MIEFQKLRYKNILSAGNAFTEILLNKAPTTLVLGTNGSGKSTMLDALTFVLFGKPFRKIKKDQLINTINQRELLVEVEFAIGTNQYLIRRGIKPNVFEVFKNSVLVDQDSTNRDYQQYLEKNILRLNFKSFTQVVVLGSSSFVPFMQLTAADRRAVIEDILDIQVFSIMNGLLKERMTGTKDDLIRLQGDLKSTKEKIGLVEQFIRTLESERDTSTANNQQLIDENLAVIELAAAEAETLNDQIADLSDTIADLDEVETRHQKLVSMREKIDGNQSKVKKDIAFFTERTDCPTCGQDIAEDFRAATVEEKTKKLQSYIDGMVKIREEIKKLSDRMVDIRVVSKKIRELQVAVQGKTSTITATRQYVRKLQSDMKASAKTGDIKTEKGKLAALEYELAEQEREREEAVELKHYYEMAALLLKDTGIKSSIIRQYLPVINKLVNKFLTDLDFFVSFSLDENFNETIKSRHRDDFSYMSFSEGEKMRIDLSILFTWREVARMKNSASSNLLILDEVIDSSLDLMGTDYFLKLIHGMGDVNNVFIISHKGDQLADKFPAVLHFAKEKGFSRIV